MTTAVTLGDGTITGLNTISIANSTAFNTLATAPTVDSGVVDSSIATTEYVHKSATKPKIDSITVNGINSLLILADGVVYAGRGNEAVHVSYGSSTKNQPLIGIRANMLPVSIPTDSRVIQCGGGNDAAWAVCENGELYTWGFNGYGQCGVNSTTVVAVPTLSASNVAEVYDHPTTMSYPHYVSRLFYKEKVTGKIYGVGYNALGGVAVNSVTSPQKAWVLCQFEGYTVGSQPTIIGFWNLGSQYGCSVAQSSDGKIWFAGNNAQTQFGFNGTANALVFKDSGSTWNGGDYSMIVKKVTGAFGNGGNNVALYMWLSNGSSDLFKCCGENSNGQMGNGGTTNQTVVSMIKVSTPSAITTALSAGKRIVDIACLGGIGTAQVLFNDGSMYTWGDNSYQQLGNGLAAGTVSTPYLISGVTALFSNGFGQNTTSAKVQNFFAQNITDPSTGATINALMACGPNTQGQLGDGTVTQRTSPVRVKLPGSVTGDKIKFIGRYSTDTSAPIIIFVTTDNSLFACGYNGNYGIQYEYTKYNNIPIPLQFTLNRS